MPGPRHAACLLAALTAAACGHTHRTTGTAAPGTFWEAPPGADPAEADRLARLTRDPRGRVVRLDRLIDLFDAARLDGSRVARETLWDALGGHPTGVGDAATTDAAARLLEEALALDRLATLSPDERAFLASAISLLSADLGRPDTAESLGDQTLAWRQLLVDGHPRIQDNAHWRLYDVVRGCIAAAVTAPDPERRREIALHAVYERTEDAAPWLEDRAPHAAPPWPGPDGLVQPLEAHLTALAALPRWSAAVARRRTSDAALQETAKTILPPARDPGWVALELPAGTGRQESFAPVLVLTPDDLEIDAGRPEATRLPARATVEQLAERLRPVLVREGSGRLLLTIPPLLPAPRVAAVLDAAALAGAEVLELAAWEPRLQGAGRVLLALPLDLARPDGTDPRSRALLGARVSLEVTGHGIRRVADGVRIDSQPVADSVVATALRELVTAYPREKVVRLDLAPDLAPEQIVTALAAVVGGGEPPFAAAGWVPRAPAPAAAEARASRLTDRLRNAARTLVAEQPYPLRDGDQARLDAFVARARVCLPEWSGPLPKDLAFELPFAEGVITDVRVAGRTGTKPAAAPARECLREESWGLRLHEHQDRFTVVLRPSPSPR